MSNHKFEILKREILARSASKVWAIARTEWDFKYIYTFPLDEGSTPGYAAGCCLCTHSPIVDHCVTKNRLNGESAVVGNECVKRFLGIDNDKLFAGLKRIQKNIEAAPNEAVIQYAVKVDIIKELPVAGTGIFNELAFLLDTRRKKFLSGKQLWRRTDFNRRLISHIERLAEIGKRKAATSAA